MKWSLLLLLAAVSVCPAGERGVPPSEGIANFGKVNDGLYRGAQPDALGLKNLKKLGIKSLINLRLTDDVWKAEETEASASGLTYTNVPLKGVGRPAPEQVEKGTRCHGKPACPGLHPLRARLRPDGDDHRLLSHPA